MAEKGEQEYKYDVFLVHSAEDTSKAQHLDEILRENGLKTYVHFKSGSGDDSEGFFIGKFVVDNITYAVQNSRTVLILVTENAITSGWVTFEIILSIEKSFKDQAMCVRLVFEGLDQDKIKQFKKGDLEYIPDFVILDFNKESWKSELIEKINQPHPTLHDVLPVGNVAHGLVFNYFAGYLRNILPTLVEYIEASSFHQQHKMLQKFVLLIPASCQVVQMDGSFGDVTVTKEKECLEIMADHGDKTRPFKLPVYRITKGEKTFYFTGDCPFIIETMRKITSFCDVAPNFLKFQVERFRKTLMELVEHRGNLRCMNTVCFVDFDDTAKDQRSSLGNALWSAVHEETQRVEIEGTKTVRKVGKLESQSSDKKYFATITNQETQADRETANDISEFLSKQNVSFTNGGGLMHVKVLGEAQWNIFVLSKDVFNNQLLLTQLNSAFQASVDNNTIQVIPILAKGTDIKDIPGYIKNMTLLVEKEDGSHLKQMWDIMQAPPKTMKEALPFIPVHQGLSYAYTVNYLAIALDGKTKEGKGFRERFQDGMVKYKMDCPCVPLVFLITSEACKFVPPGSQFDNEKYVGKLEPVVIGVREYYIHLYELTMKNGKKVCYAREYTTPSVSLHEMAHKYPFAGMNVDQMKREASDFVELCSKITNDEQFKSHIGDIKDKCVFVYYKDEEETMTDALEKELQSFLDGGEVIAPPELT